MTRQSARASGLDLDVPESGIARDAFEVARTALALRDMGNGNGGLTNRPAAHAVTLHRISGQLHRLAERQCNEDLTCRKCGGAGQIPLGEDPYGRTCNRCAGRGTTIGRREERLERQVRDIAEHYGLVPYFQGDPRGCALYLIAPDVIPTDRRFLAASGYQHEIDAGAIPSNETLRGRWIDSNYTRGHAVTRLGR